MGVMDRANSKIPASGDYLDKDELIRDQEPMALVSVTFDSVGSQFGARWVCSVQPWFEDQDGPTGLITFTNNPTRQPLFEDLQAQIEENGNEPIGPVVIIKGKSQAGYRFYSFGDWTEGGVAAAPAPAPAPAPKAQRATRAASAPAPTPAPAPAPEAAKRRPGRPRKAAEAAPSSPSAPALAPKPEVAPGTGVASVSLAVGQAICPDCNQLVTGRVLDDDKGNRVIIHPHCPATGRAGVVMVTDATV
jgi:hypothetical protein